LSGFGVSVRAWCWRCYRLLPVAGARRSGMRSGLRSCACVSPVVAGERGRDPRGRFATRRGRRSRARTGANARAATATRIEGVASRARSRVVSGGRGEAAAVPGATSDRGGLYWIAVEAEEGCERRRSGARRTGRWASPKCLTRAIRRSAVICAESGPTVHCHFEKARHRVRWRGPCA
jgi:hypothetical protein